MRLRVLPLFIFIVAGMLLFGVAVSHAFNPVQDVLQNTTFPIGQVAAAGTAINLRNGETSTSMLAEVAEYRGRLGLYYGGTRVNQNDANFTDTAKLGLNLAWVFSKFANPLSPQAQFLKKLNIGPSFAINLISGPRKGTPFMDINYVFGGH